MGLKRTVKISGVMLLASLCCVGFLMPEFINKTDCKRDTSQLHFRQLGDALSMHKLQTGQYPTNREGLAHLTSAHTHGHQGKFISTLPQNRWRNDYYYFNLEERLILLWDLGADSLPGGAEGGQDLCYLVNQHTDNPELTSHIEAVLAKLPKEAAPVCTKIYSGAAHH
ncbi:MULTISPECIES: type II secretion system protein GspG [unclassified Pseudoalteromonas]|uniref:type II secretion system protein GspG n=1 Tax=unclassified Pseudoalteromonas TaxID=194690 RepID=UPI00209858E5|nr:type II secretion system protein GspG [Pseudoalteromonas sp. XMcav2-N]MCO7187200.1 type II secretion system protein GspG [Pseudoalteromonas sp. XMcav2-N]